MYNRLVILVIVIMSALFLYYKKDNFVDKIAVNAGPVTFKKTGGYGNGYQLKMCLNRRKNPEQNCNSLVGITEYPQSSAHPTPFHKF